MLEKNSIARRRSAFDSMAAARRSGQPSGEPGPFALRPLQAEARWSLRLPERAAEGVSAVAGFQLDQPINRFRTRHGRTAARLGPDEWLLLAPEADAEMVATELTASLKSQHHALIDISHRNAALTVSGPAAAAVLNAGCPLDLHPDRFPVGMATRTLLGKCEILLFRQADDPSATYRVECWRSFATYVSAFLTDASREFGNI
jgi:sarcosine oxidase, subunit gamma